MTHTVPPAAADPIADLAARGQMENIFATPIFRHVLADADALNAELRELILERERRVASQTKSNQGGWQSSADFFGWGGSAVGALERHVRTAVKVATARAGIPLSPALEFQLFGWGAVNRKGHYNTGHVHPGATWSGVYYVDPGDDPDPEGAVLEFEHPVVAAVMTFFPGLFPSARVVRPEAGMMVMFPSYLQHGVRLYRGERPRICVPFNAHVRSPGG
jgi:uncharacterized protein (TIGR02466 family)